VTNLFSEPWFVWALTLALGFPILAVVFGEMTDRLEREGRAFASVARALRNFGLPTVVVFLFVTKVLDFDGETTVARLTLTALWTALLFVALTALNVLLFEQAGSDSWRSRVPRLFLDLVRLFLVFLGGALVLGVVWNHNLGGLLAALGVGSIVIGLALQDTLGSLMSGIALLFERPFAIGDWIKLSNTEGEVVEINWRSVRLRSRERDLLVVPNSVLAKEMILNTNEPTLLHAERIAVAFAMDVPPNRVRDILSAVANDVPNVLHDPKPKVEVMEFCDDRIRYEVKLYTENLRAVPRIRSEFTTRAWYAAQRAGLDFPMPIRIIRTAEAVAREDEDRAATALRPITVFANLGGEERKRLVESARVLHYAVGEVALLQGDPCERLAILASGEVRTSLRTKAGEVHDVERLGPGDLFGEGALLMRERSPVTVTALSDLEVVALDTDALKRILEHNPTVASELGQVVELRRRAVHHAKQTLRSVGEASGTEAERQRSSGSMR